METVQMELTSGASSRLIRVFRDIRQSLLSWRALRRFFLLIQSVFLWFFLLLQHRLVWFSSALRRRENRLSVSKTAGSKRKAIFREEDDVLRRRSLAEDLDMDAGSEFGTVCNWSTGIFFGSRCNALFSRSWIPVAGDMKGILIIIHGLNEHSGRYTHFARQLTMCNFGVYAMDWIGHGGSDGLHGYVPSLDHVVSDTAAFLGKIKTENPGIPCFLFGHSTGGAVVLKAALCSDIESMVGGIILTSPALRVKPAHPIVGAVAPIFSLVLPKLQFKGANKRGIPVSRDPAALLAKYSDPLVYTGPIRVRTGHEILRISSFLTQNLKSVSVPFLVLHGTADKVTDPLASQDLYNEASSEFKHIKLYEGFLHDLLFEPEREEVAADIIDWMEKRLQGQSW